MNRSLSTFALCATVLAGCATTGAPPPADGGPKVQVTGSNIPKRLRPGENYDVAVGNREEYERQMDKAHTLPRPIPGQN